MEQEVQTTQLPREFVLVINKIELATAWPSSISINNNKNRTFERVLPKQSSHN